MAAADEKLNFKVYELKGMVSSFVHSAKHHDSYNYPMIKNIEGLVNEMVTIISKRDSKPLVMGHYAPPLQISKSKGFHKNA